MMHANEAVLLIHWTGGRHTRGSRSSRQDRPISRGHGAYGR